MTFSTTEIITALSLAIGALGFFNSVISSKINDIDNKKQSKDVCAQTQITFEKQNKLILEMFHELKLSNEKLADKVDRLIEGC